MPVPSDLVVTDNLGNKSSAACLNPRYCEAAKEARALFTVGRKNGAAGCGVEDVKIEVWELGKEVEKSCARHF